MAARAPARRATIKHRSRTISRSREPGWTGPLPQVHSSSSQSIEPGALRIKGVCACTTARSVRPRVRRAPKTRSHTANSERRTHRVSRAYLRRRSARTPASCLRKSVIYTSLSLHSQARARAQRGSRSGKVLCAWYNYSCCICLSF